MEKEQITISFQIVLPHNVTVVDVKALLAGWKFLLRGIFPEARIRADFSTWLAKSKEKIH